MMEIEVKKYHELLEARDRSICEKLYEIISRELPDAENKVWHAHPVWFLDGNPIVGYSKRKDSICLMFWSGQSFDEMGLTASGSFKAAEVHYTDVNQIIEEDLIIWLKKSRDVQWDYKDIVKRKGELVRLK